MAENGKPIKFVYRKVEPAKPVKWSEIKKVLIRKEPKELLSLIKDLYSLNKQNKTFVLTKYALVDPLEPYKDIIEDCLCPDVYEPLDISMGKKAISQYKKAVGDPIGLLDLMIFYVECGNDFTCEYGDIDEGFYNSLELMFAKALQALVKLDQSMTDKFLPRMQAIVKKADGIGWGYYDTISDLLWQYFPDEQ